jgi:hypothetical protein
MGIKYFGIYLSVKGGKKIYGNQEGFYAREENAGRIELDGV